MSETRRIKLGVVGHPVKHSLSAAMHSAAYRKLDMDCSYSLYDIEEKSLGDFIGLCRKDHLGLNVTIPHKVEVMKFLDRIDPGAKVVGAVNTIKFEGGEAIGYNTDGAGFIASLREAGADARGKNALVFGAGGAARAVLSSLAGAGANITLCNRDQKKAGALGEELLKKTGKKIRVVPLTVSALRDPLASADIIVNTTSVGMFPGTDESILPGRLIPSKALVVDIVYNPVETRLLKDASKLGCRTVSGVGMLVHQGAESFRIWFGTEPPIDDMRTAVLAELAKRR